MIRPIVRLPPIGPASRAHASRTRVACRTPDQADLRCGLAASRLLRRLPAGDRHQHLLLAAGRHDPPPDISPEEAVADIRDVLDSIGDTCPECLPD